MARSDGMPDVSRSRHSSPRPQVRAPDGFPPSLQPLLARIADRRAARSEATLQSDIRQLLLAGDFGLSGSHLDDIDLEAPAGGGRRIDIEVGYTIIEVKRGLQTGRRLRDAERQLAGYVWSRCMGSGQRYVGILTDGATWRAYQLTGEAELTPSTPIRSLPTRRRRSGPLLLAGRRVGDGQRVRPAHAEVDRRGSGRKARPTSWIVTRSLALYTGIEHAAVEMKRRLWARLLDSALGTQFEDDDELFVEHTTLVNTRRDHRPRCVGFDALESQPQRRS